MMSEEGNDQPNFPLSENESGRIGSVFLLDCWTVTVKERKMRE